VPGLGVKDVSNIQEERMQAISKWENEVMHQLWTAHRHNLVVYKWDVVIPKQLQNVVWGGLAEVREGGKVVLTKKGREWCVSKYAQFGAEADWQPPEGEYFKRLRAYRQAKYHFSKMVQERYERDTPRNNKWTKADQLKLERLERRLHNTKYALIKA
jgi:hypothetical protein